LLLGCAQPPAEPDIARGDYNGLGHHLDRWVEHEVRRSDLVGLSIAIVDRDSVVYARGFGYADREAGVPATPQTVYRVGSIAKPVTATLVMQLVEKGKVDLDAPLSAYLPDFSIRSRYPDTGPLTVGDILAHQAGIPNLWRDSTADGRPVPFNELVDDMSEAYLVHPPRYVTKYSTQGHNLIGCMIEAMSGTPFAAYADHTLFHPLGMRTASYSPDPAAHARLATAYRKGEPVASLPPVDGDLPSSGLHASVLDLIRFLELFTGDGVVDGQRILEPETVEAMLTPVSAIPLDFDEQAGPVWFHSAPAGLGYAGAFVMHGGSTFLFHSKVLIHPEHRLGVAVCSNTAEGREAVQRITDETMRLALEVKTGLSPPGGDEGGAREEPGLDWESFAGRYQTQVGIVDVDVDKHINATLLGKRLRLVPHTGDWASVRYVLLGSIPVPPPGVSKLRFSFAVVDGHRVLVVDNGGRKSRLGERIEPVAIPDVWRGREGDYNLANATHGDVAFEEKPHLQLRVEGEYLVAYVHPAIHPSVQLSWAVFPINDTEAVFAGFSNYLGGEMLRIIRVENRERVEFSGYEFERGGG
jgi:CubicO group peptidase (beta-lactamase class C family)